MRAAADRSAPPDPASRFRAGAFVLTLVAIWPMLVWSEFKPWILFDAQSLSATGRFLAAFFPPEHSPDFLQIAAEATWQTVAMATAGMALALLGAVPLTIVATERLSISRIGTGRMQLPGRIVRQAVRWLLIGLRSVPELVWALLFVRIVGLGPTAGVSSIEYIGAQALTVHRARITLPANHSLLPRQFDNLFDEPAHGHATVTKLSYNFYIQRKPVDFMRE